jgi:gliding motility-associated-like protein
VSDTVSIISSGSLAISAGPVTTICIGQTFTLTAAGGTNYLWSTGNTTSSISVSPTVTTSYSVAVTDTVSGCSGDTVVKITVSPPPVASATSATVCSGQSATLTASGGGNYLWNSGETTASITPVATSATTYSVLVSIGTCTASANSSVNVTPAPSVNLGSNQTICSGQNGTFNAGNSGASYLWSTGETSQSISVSSAGTYWVVVALNNCLAKDTVKTFSAPQIHLHDSSLCTTSPILLDAGDGAGSYLWSNGSTAQTISVDVSGSYWVQAMFGNCLSADTSHIAGEAGLGSLYVPNAFTPNGDHLNEIFLAKGTGIISFDMKVFDRWGNLIFISNDINKGWSGIIQGGNYALKNDGSEAAQEDVYIWKISYTTECYPKKVEKLMGQISIVK